MKTGSPVLLLLLAASILGAGYLLLESRPGSGEPTSSAGGVARPGEPGADRQPTDPGKKRKSARPRHDPDWSRASTTRVTQIAPVEPAPPEAHPERAERGFWTPDRQGIQAAVQEAFPDVRACYDDALKRQPALAASLALSFKVAAADTGGPGFVEDVDLAGIEQSADLDFEDCLYQSFYDMRFEAPQEGGVEVQMGLVFKVEP